MTPYYALSRRARPPFPFEGHRTMAEVMLTEYMMELALTRQLLQSDFPMLDDLLRRAMRNNPPQREEN